MAATKQTGAAGRKLDALTQQAKNTEKVLVRIKPRDRKRGQYLSRFTAFGALFEEAKGWYLVDAHVGEYLKTIRARPAELDCLQMAFDVCTPDEAAAIHNGENERAIRQGRAAPTGAHAAIVPRDATSGSKFGTKVDPGYITTKDLAPERDEAPPTPPARTRSIRPPKPAEEV